MKPLYLLICAIISILFFACEPAPPVLAPELPEYMQVCYPTSIHVGDVMHNFARPLDTPVLSKVGENTAFGYNNGVDPNEGYFFVTLYNDPNDQLLESWTVNYDRDMRFLNQRIRNAVNDSLSFSIQNRYNDRGMVSDLIHVLFHGNIFYHVECDEWGNPITVSHRSSGYTYHFTYDRNLKNPLFRAAVQDIYHKAYQLLPYYTIAPHALLSMTVNNADDERQSIITFEYHDHNENGFPTSATLTRQHNDGSISQDAVRYEYHCSY